MGGSGWPGGKDWSTEELSDSAGSFGSADEHVFGQLEPHDDLFHVRRAFGGTRGDAFHYQVGQAWGGDWIQLGRVLDGLIQEEAVVALLVDGVERRECRKRLRPSKE